MNRDGYLLEKCPTWCAEQEHFADDIMNIKTHQTVGQTFVPASSNGGHNTVSLAIGQTEALQHGGAGDQAPVFLLLVADDAELSAAEARQVAAWLLAQADRLDEIKAAEL